MGARAQAAELVYWDNYGADPQTISGANIDGSGGGALNLTGIDLKGPEGMAFDSLTGRLYVAASSAGPEKKGEIDYVNVDGSGAGVFNTSGVPMDEPYGVAIDPASRTIYWVNGGPDGAGSIGYAKLDGGGGGLLNTSGVTVEDPYKLAVDPTTGKVFWGNTGGESIAYANLNNSGGGGTLNLTGAPPLNSVYAVAVDSAAGRVYWLDSTTGKNHLSFASVNGGSGGEVSLTSSVFDNAYGLAIDPTVGRAYWANYGNSEDRTGAIGFADLAGGGGGISPQTAPLHGPQDPIILKSPTVTGTPTIAQDAKKPASLTCSQGSWGADFPGSFVYQAPRSYAYQWSNNGVAIAGAAAAAYLATAPGSYTCAVTATNQAGTAGQTSAATKIVASKVKLKTKKKAKVKPGGVATFKVTALNQGDLEAKTAKVCAKLPKKAKKAMKAPKCKKFGKLAADGKRTATLKFKVKGNAKPGTYKLTFQVKGSAGKAAKAKVIVQAPKPKKK